MRIDTHKLRQLRQSKHWSQEELATICGLTTRTIQRVEATGKVSVESAKALASAFGVDVSKLMVQEPETETSLEHNAVEYTLRIIQGCFVQFGNFEGKASRKEYWLFFSFCFVIMSIATIIHQHVASIVGLLIILPLMAVGARRLHDAGYSGWWQFFALVPIGILWVLYMLSLEPKNLK
jgi:transcriptional regulator with XRE-family HTH domain